MRRFFVSLAVCIAFCSVSPGADRPDFDIPRLDEITIDGRSDDWSGKGFAVNVLWDRRRQQAHPADFAPRFRLGWTDRGLAVLIEVRDDKVVLAEGQAIPGADSVELYLANAAKPQMHYQLVASVSPDGSGMEHFHNDRRIDRTARLQDQIAGRKTKDGYVIEVLMPFAGVYLQPKQGDQIGFTLQVNDVDAAGEARKMSIWYPRGWASNGLSMMHRVRLAEKASPSVNAIAGLDIIGSGRLGRLTFYSARPTDATIGLRAGSRHLLQAKPQPIGNQAWLRHYLALPEEAEKLSCQADGRQVALEIFRQTKPLQLQADTAVLDEKSGEIRIDMSLPLPAENLDAGRVRVTVSDVDGKQIVDEQLALGSPARIRAGQGLHTVHAELTDFFGVSASARSGFQLGQAGREQVGKVLETARRFISHSPKSAYAGWLGFQLDKLASSSGHEQPAPQRRVLAVLDLAAALREAREGKPISRRTGRFEWAYLSKVDGTAQPFTLFVQDSYTPDRKTPLFVYLHGSGGTHQGRWLIAPGDAISLSVMGRARRSGYDCLSEIDVLEAMEFVQTHWNIDPDRIYLSGGSMGGGGTFGLAMRFPDRFAAVRPICGYMYGLPIENLLHVPLATLHSDDDPAVPITQSRIAAEKLADMGGQVVRFETTGFGHGVSEWSEGELASREWMMSHARQESPARVCYRATDELARKAWWVEIVEWGPEHRPAGVDARIGSDNTLFVDLDNVALTRLNLHAAPADADADMPVVINRKIVTRLKAPLPKTVWLQADGQGVGIRQSPPEMPTTRLHYPGGMPAMYHGQPLMIVYGTGGDDDRDAELKALAERISQSPDPAWNRPGNVMEFAKLPVKSDRECTRHDLQNRNLILIGTAGENTVVDRMAHRLPIRIAGGRVHSTDGDCWSFQGRVFGLLHYNPLAPKRLMYWIAAASPAGYALDSPLGQDQYPPASPDFLLLQPGKYTQTVAARCFDSRWNWAVRADQSPRITPDWTVKREREATVAAMARRTGSEIVILRDDWDRNVPRVAPGVSREIDLINLVYFLPMARIEMTGERIRAVDTLFAKAADSEHPDYNRFFPAPGIRELQPGLSYKVGVLVWDLWDIGSRAKYIPENYELLDSSLRDVMVDVVRLEKQQGQ